MSSRQKETHNLEFLGTFIKYNSLCVPLQAPGRPGPGGPGGPGCPGCPSQPLPGAPGGP